MRNYLRFGNILALGAGAAGMALAAWLYAAGPDEKGLYPANHAAWIGLSILTVAVVAVFWLLSRHAGASRSFRQNFPASIPGAFGYAAAAIGLLSGGLEGMQSGMTLGLVTGIVGTLGVVGLFWTAVCRLRGQRAGLPVHCLPCFYFALQLFVLGQAFGSEPEMCRYLYRFLATAAMVPACYWLWSFDVNLGKRPDCVFWCLVAGYCNLVAAVGSGQALLHLSMAIWMLTALPKLCYLPKQPKHAPEPIAEPVPVPESFPVEEVFLATDLPDEEEVQPAADLLVAEEVEPVADLTIAEDAQPDADPLSVELPDADAILEELLRDFGSQENA